jgi:hypothetical protein
MTRHCPSCGRFMAYAPHLGGWQCMADWCGRIWKPPPAPEPTPEEHRKGQERIRRAIHAMLTDEEK